MDETLAGIVAHWPGRFRHPRLVVELARTPAEALDGRGAARLLLAGLADPLTEDEGVRRLIDDGEFSTVDALFDAEDGGDAEPWRGIAGEWSREIPALLDDARAAARSDVAREAAVLRERARRIGRAPGDLSAARDAAGRRLADARAVLVQEEARLRREERAAAEELRGRLSGPADPRFAAVEACLAVGEFPTARWLLETDRDDTGQGGPRSVGRPPRWPWYTHTAEEALGWYEDGAHLPYPQLARFVRARRDPTVVAVLDRLRALTAHRDAASVGAFAAGLGGLLGEDLQCPVDERGGGFATTLVGLDDARLPRLPVLRRAGVPLWVADAGVNPPDDLARPGVWFVPGNADGLVGPAGTAVLDIPGLLCLLAPPEDDIPATVPGRRVNLLRMLVPQLGLDGMTGEAGGIELSEARPRDSLAWLLDLLGIGADAVVLDTLDYETGRHPLAVPAILEILLEALRKRRAYTLALFDLDAVRTPGAREWLRELLFGPLAPAERAMLGLAGALSPFEPFDAEELASFAHLVGLPEDVAPERLLRPALAADALVDSRLLDRHDSGRYRIAHSGVGDLARTGPGWNAAQFAEKALKELLRELGDAHAAARALAGEKLVEHARHREANIAAGLETAIERARSGDGAGLEKISGLARQLRDASSLWPADLRPSETCDLGELVASLARRFEWTLARIVVRTIGAEPGVHRVHAVRVLLEAALENLLTNAAQAIEATPGEEGEILMTVSGADGRCVIDIEDSGPGLTDEQHGDLTAGRSFSTKNGSGSGVATTRSLAREAGGDLEIPRRSARLGGAHLRVWLPAR